MSSEKTDHSGVADSKVNWLPLVLGALVVFGLIIFIFKGCKGSNESEAVINSDTTTSEISTSMPAEANHESVKVKLPDGIELSAFKGGIEDQLVLFLNTPSSVPGKDVWFDFDNLNFKTGTADVVEESVAQLNNIAAILKAFPKVKIKIGGYTDKTGDSLNNIRLSQNRADTVKTALIKSGTNTSQIEGAEGYGSQYATVAASASDEERKKDRRISLSVRAK
jgi:outer membrane protein OmpA-like peptidoglycan-associated protein